MRVLLARLRAARIDRLAATLRRRHLILQRPQIGRLILEAVGLAPRLLTLQIWHRGAWVPWLPPGVALEPQGGARARPVVRWPLRLVADRGSLSAAPESRGLAAEPSGEPVPQPSLPNAESGFPDQLGPLEGITDPAIAEMVAQTEVASESPAAPRLEPPGPPPVPRPAAPESPTSVVREVPAEAAPPRIAAAALLRSPAAAGPAEPVGMAEAASGEPGEAPPAARQPEPTSEAVASLGPAPAPAPAPAIPESEAPIAFGPTLEPFRLPPGAVTPPRSAPPSPPPRSEFLPAPSRAAPVVSRRPTEPVGPAAAQAPEPIGLPEDESSRAAAGSPIEPDLTAPLRVEPPGATTAAETATFGEAAGLAPHEATRPHQPPAAEVVPQSPSLAESDLAAIVETESAPTPTAAPPRAAEVPSAASPPRIPEPTAAQRWQPVEERRARPPGHRPAPLDAARAAETAADPAAASAETLATDTPAEEAPATPVEWLARLQRAFATKPAAGSKARQPAPTGEPISIGAREILEPLVGTEAGAARVHRGPAPARLLSALRADAVTVGDQIVLGEGRQEDDPKTVGLLAHELVHVARQRTPRFVPPVLAGSPRVPLVVRPTMQVPATTGPRSMAAAARPASRVGGPSRAADPDRPRSSGREWDPEESMAVEVEAAAIAAAREHRRAPRPRGELVRPTEPGQAGTVIGTRGDGEEQRAGRWGSLPAPWEPLPDFLEGSMESAEPAESTAAAGHTAEAAFPATAGVPAVRLAPSDRHVPEAPAHGGAEAGAAPGGAKPDLDLLARQVYTILKRRLDGERRRAM